MTSKKLEHLWTMYPKSHLHCDVTAAGHNSYQVIVSLITDTGEIVATVENFGSGDLDTIKAQTFANLAERLQHVGEA